MSTANVASSGAVQTSVRPVLYQPRANGFVAKSIGSGACVFDISSNHGSAGQYGYKLTAPATGNPYTTAQSGGMQARFRGSLIGIRPTLLAANVGIPVAYIDEVDYGPIRDVNPKIGNIAGSPSVQGVQDIILADDLDPKAWHTLELLLVGDPTLSNTFAFAGLVVDGNVNAVDNPLPLITRTTTFSVLTGANGFIDLTQGSYRWVRKLAFYNSGAGTTPTVTIQWTTVGSLSTTNVIAVSPAIAPGATWEYDFGERVQAHIQLEVLMTLGAGGGASGDIKMNVLGGY